MKYVIFFLLFATVAHAQTTRLYDSKNKYIGQTRENDKGEVKTYDEKGRLIEKSVRQHDGSTKVYDAHGKLIGSTKPNK